MTPPHPVCWYPLKIQPVISVSVTCYRAKMGHCLSCGEGVIVLRTRPGVVEVLELLVLVRPASRKPSGQQEQRGCYTVMRFCWCPERPWKNPAEDMKWWLQTGTKCLWDNVWLRLKVQKHQMNCSLWDTAWETPAVHTRWFSFQFVEILRRQTLKPLHLDQSWFNMIWECPPPFSGRFITIRMTSELVESLGAGKNLLDRAWKKNHPQGEVSRTPDVQNSKRLPHFKRHALTHTLSHCVTQFRRAGSLRRSVHNNICVFQARQLIRKQGIRYALGVT